jgi:mannobiose 2-epimerase
MLQAMAEETLRLAWTPGNGFAAEMERGRVDTTRVWWVQAEALLGFLRAWERTGEETFLTAARDQWDYIRARVIDPRCGEWHWSLREDGSSTGKPFVEPWKCPYHNGRMCFEVIRKGSL